VPSTARQEARRRYEEKNREKRRLDRHKTTRFERRKEQYPLEVLFIDGEGNKQPDEHLFYVPARKEPLVGKEDRYWLLQASDGSILRCQRGSYLSTQSVFEWLFTLKRPRRHLVCYGMGYDLTHWLRDLPDDTFRKAREEDGVWCTLGDYRYHIRRYGLKKLELTRWDRRVVGVKGEKIVVDDCLSGFGGSFTSALTAWKIGSPEEWASLERMKGLRGDFASLSEEEIIAYNDLECRLGAELMAAYVEAVKEAVGREPTSFHGAGALASLLLKAKNVKPVIQQHRVELPATVASLMERSFFGGQFQCFQVGHIGPVGNADLCAAYPSGIARLPAPGGSWRHQRGYQVGAPHGVWKVSWDTRDTTEPFTPFPWRARDGGIHYPPVGQGWYHCCEVDAAIRIWGDKIQVSDGWLYTPPQANPYPFWDWMHEDFAKRLEWGKTGKGMVIKLGDNSCYGKFAEKQIGKELPPFKLPFYAGEITARTRAAIKDFAAPIWDRVVGIQCDGVLFTGEQPDIRYAKELGEMEPIERYDDCWMFQPGLGVLTGPKGAKVKGRGIPEKTLDLPLLAAAWEEKHTWATVTIEGRERFVSRDLAIHMGHPEQAYHWIKQDKEIGLRPGRGDDRLMQAIPGKDAFRWHSYDYRNYDCLSSSYKPSREETMELARLREGRLLEENNG
jgi:hypothetical protein